MLLAPKKWLDEIGDVWIDYCDEVKGVCNPDCKEGDRFKAICGEHCHGDVTIGCQDYWAPIMDVLPSNVMVTWTGPQIWNKKLNASDVPDIRRPIMLFDNYFASDTDDPARSPIYPYKGRDPDLASKITGVVINPNNHFGWQFCALNTAMKFWSGPDNYDPNECFRQAIRDLGDLSVVMNQG